MDFVVSYCIGGGTSNRGGCNDLQKRARNELSCCSTCVCKSGGVSFARSHKSDWLGHLTVGISTLVRRSGKSDTRSDADDIRRRTLTEVIGTLQTHVSTSIRTLENRVDRPYGIGAREIQCVTRNVVTFLRSMGQPTRHVRQCDMCSSNIIENKIFPMYFF
jgi:hypothetical protein